MKSIKASLLISTYNWPSALDLVLKSVLAQSTMPAEVIIADDGSKKETADVIKKYQENFPVPVIHVWHEDNGFRKTKILNKALKNAKSEYVIQIDGDIILNKHFIRDHINEAKKGYFIKGSRGRLTKKKSEIIMQSKKIDICSLEIGVQSKLNATRIPLFSPFFYSDSFYVRNVKGCNFAFWLSDFFAVNGYNNELQGWGHEDIEFAARLANIGIKRRQLKMVAVCFHIYHLLESKSRENYNYSVYEEVVKNKVIRCKNGITQDP